MGKLHWDVAHLRRITWIKRPAELWKGPPGSGCSAEEFPLCPANNPPLYRGLTSTANPTEQLKYRSGSCSQSPLVTFESWGKEMEVANTITDLGKKLRKPVKRGYHPRNKSLQDPPHPNPKSLVYFEDEILKQKWSLKNDIQLHWRKQATAMVSQTKAFFAIQTSLLKISISFRNPNFITKINQTKTKFIKEKTGLTLSESLPRQPWLKWK